MKEYLPILKQTQLFAGLSDMQILTMLGCLSAVRREYPKGEFVLAEGDTVDTFGLVLAGQVLVIHDLLGMSGKFRPKFVKQYAQLEDNIKQAVHEFIDEVRTEKFPGDEHSFK